MKRAWIKSKQAAQVAVLTVTTALGGTVAGVATADTLAGALSDAYKNSGLLEQNRAVLRAADEDVAQAVAALRPVLSWAWDVTRQFGTQQSAQTGNVAAGFNGTSTTLGLSASLMLYDFGSSKGQVDIAKESVLATRQALVSVEQNVLLQAVDAYTRVRTGAETLALRQNNVRVITEELRAAKDRF